MTAIVPGRLLRLKIFESRDYYYPAAGGRRRVPHLSTLPLGPQVDDWVDATKNLIVSVGPVNVLFEEADSVEPLSGGLPIKVTCEIRTVAVVYARAVEHGKI